MHFSLIMATIGRTQEISRFLEKLSTQTYQNFELIVVDQNQDNRLTEILNPYKNSICIIHLRTSIKGASRARNIGIEASKGDIIAFPDDDCWYPDNLLYSINNLLEAHPEWDGLSATTAEASYWDKHSGTVGRFNAWKRVIEYCIFLRRGIILEVGKFDEELGPGSGTPFWAGEITDYILRALRGGHKIYYEPSLKIHHPGPITVEQSNGFDSIKSYHYAMGKGRVLRKSNAPLWFVTYQCIKPLVNLTLGVAKQDTDKKKMSWAIFQGIIRGWLGVN